MRRYASKSFIFQLTKQDICKKLLEGTRYTQEKHEASIEFAKSRGLPVFKHHLLPRTRGFKLLMSLGKTKSMIFEIQITTDCLVKLI